MKNHRLHVRLGFAVAGLMQCWRTESSFRTHVMAGAVALAALILLRPSPIWWALVMLVCMLVMAFEALNSALERLIDHLHPEIHPEIGVVKDMAAGAVLLLSIGAVIIAACLGASLLNHGN